MGPHLPRDRFQRLLCTRWHSPLVRGHGPSAASPPAGLQDGRPYRSCLLAAGVPHGAEPRAHRGEAAGATGSSFREECSWAVAWTLLGWGCQNRSLSGRGICAKLRSLQRQEGSREEQKVTAHPCCLPEPAWPSPPSLRVPALPTRGPPGAAWAAAQQSTAGESGCNARLLCICCYGVSAACLDPRSSQPFALPIYRTPVHHGALQNHHGVLLVTEGCW